jgi:hypothetical protein
LTSMGWPPYCASRHRRTKGVVLIDTAIIVLILIASLTLAYSIRYMSNCVRMGPLILVALISESHKN